MTGAPLILALWESRRVFVLALAILICDSSGAASAPVDPRGSFDQANKLYEEGRYREAAAAYQALLKDQPASPNLLFNLGNSWFKSGELGRAIVAYRKAQRVLPRDPALRFNLAFARKQLVGLPPPRQPAWARAVSTLTLNEWTLLTSALWWLLMILLILRELFPSLQRVLRSYTFIAASLILLPLSGLLLHLYLQHEHPQAVIVTSSAQVRLGPLAESQSHFQLRNGAELRILDQKNIQDESWVRVEDATGRTGWVSDRDLVRLD